MDLKILLQILGATLGILYLILEYRANAWLWIVGMIMPIIHGILYFHSGLYADFGMQVYYLVASLYGLTQWHKQAKNLPITRTPRRLYIPLLLTVALLNVALYFLLVAFTDSTVPFFDALTTALSIVAMWMLARKYLEQWLVWLLTDLITVGLYTYKSLYITAALYLLYSILAIAGYRKWKLNC